MSHDVILFDDQSCNVAYVVTLKSCSEGLCMSVLPKMFCISKILIIIQCIGHIASQPSSLLWDLLKDLNRAWDGGIVFAAAVYRNSIAP